MSDNELIKQALILNQEKSKLHKYYNERSHDYDKDVITEDYAGPRTIASLAEALYCNVDGETSPTARKNSRVLDAGCGTGLAGVALAANGFENIVGVDLSPKMIIEPEKTKAYQTLCGNIDLTQPISAQIARASNC